MGGRAFRGGSWVLGQSIAGPVISLFAAREGRVAGSGRASAFDHMRWLWTFALVIGAGLAAVWPLAVLVVFGSGYPQAAQVGQLGIAGFLPSLIGTSLMAGILVGGRTLPLLLTGALQGAVMVSLALVLVPSLGLVGFFAAQTAAGTATVVLRLTVLGMQTGGTPLRPWMGPLLAATLILFAALILDMQIDETALQRAVVAAVALPALGLWIAFTAMTGPERVALLARARQLLVRVRVGKGPQA